MRRVGAALLVALIFVLAGCSSRIDFGSASSTHSPSAPTSSPASSHLLEVKDPGQVTGTYARTHCHARENGTMPDPACNPGSIDPVVTQANIHKTICVSHYTEYLRPPTSQTNKLKFEQAYPAYGIPESVKGELDHLIPLELGGSNDATNLWPEVGKIPNPKDPVETRIKHAVCDGKVTLAAAQEAIAHNWKTAEQVLHLS